jgi:osmotically-inducible protein OsmY
MIGSETEADMETMTTVRTDAQIQQAVLAELGWDTRVKPTEIGVSVEHGIVTLTGTVESFAKKLAARDAAHRVAGVLDVADDIEVRIPSVFSRTDADIAAAVRRALEWDTFVHDRKVRSTVADGWVTLEGTLDTLFEREDAEKVIRRLMGVRGVINNIAVTGPSANPIRLRNAIQETLERRADREAGKIDIHVHQGRVTLDGRVHSWAEREAVLGTVQHAPGVQFVVDHLRIEPYF